MLVRASGSGVSRWRDAVPALVSKVETDLHVSVLVPNLLTLRHDFRGRPFRALSGLELCQIRPYQGSDQPMLKDALLRAVQTLAASRNLARSAPSTDAVTSCAANNHDCNGERASEVSLADNQPETPTPRKMLERRITPPKPPAAVLPIPKVLGKRVQRSDEAEPSKAPVAEGSSCCLGRLRISRRRIEEITIVIARAFTTWGDGTLTRAEVWAIILESGLDVSSSELEGTLVHLDKNNKVYLTGDLVIRV